MSTITLDPIALDIREQRVLGYLRPALEEASRRNRPIGVEALDTSLTTSELVALAARLCRHEHKNVAVVASPTDRGVILVPLQ
jgi:hypothetical protein